MSFSAADVKKLREATGAGMMACKNALNESNGNMDEAIDLLRKKGLAAAKKKQSRIAAEGEVLAVVEGNQGVILEVNCETDFVSKGDDFKNFTKSIADFVMKNNVADITALKSDKDTEVNELTLKIGEKIDIRRCDRISEASAVGYYNHGGRISVLVGAKTTANEGAPELQTLLKDLAMHIAAADPKFIDANDIDETFKKKEAEIYAAQLKEEGKPEKMIDKIVEGKLRKLASDVCLLEQKYIKNPDITVKKLIEEASKAIGAEITIPKFAKFNLGEGIEKKEDNLADEVAKLTSENN